MKLIIKDGRIVATATDDYSGQEHWVFAAEDFEQERLAEYRLIDDKIQIPEHSYDVIAQMYAQAVQKHLDATAQSYGYDSIHTAVTYADEPAVPRFQDDGKAFRTWRSLCWEYCYSLLDQALKGTNQQLSVEDVIAGLPAIDMS